MASTSRHAHAHAHDGSQARARAPTGLPALLEVPLVGGRDFVNNAPGGNSTAASASRDSAAASLDSRHIHDGCKDDDVGIPVSSLSSAAIGVGRGALVGGPLGRDSTALDDAQTSTSLSFDKVKAETQKTLEDDDNLRTLPCLELALARAETLKLYDSVDDKGKEDDNATSKLFPLWASPMRIGRSSLGMGLYFTSILVLLGLVAVLTVVNIVPFVDNISQSRLTEAYKLRVPAHVPESATAFREVTCNRNYEVASYITMTSQGARCFPGDGVYTGADTRTNVLLCPAVCTYSGKDALTGVDMQEPCTSIPICGLAQTDKCCKLKLKVDGFDDAWASRQAWFVFVNTFVLVLGVLALEYVLCHVATKLNRYSHTVGDYCVFVDRLPMPTNALNGDATAKELMTSKEGLIDFFSHYGEIAKACHVLDVGRQLRTARKIERMRRKREELACYERDVNSVPGYPFARILELVWWMHVTGHPSKLVWATADSASRNREILDARLARQSDRLKALTNADELSTVGEAFIVFNYEEHANNCFKDLAYRVSTRAPKTLQRLYSFFKRDGIRPSYRDFLEEKLRELTGDMGKALNEVSDWVKTALGINQLRVKRAPEPTDYIWENTHIRTLEQTWRITISNALVIAMLALSAVIQQQIEFVKRNEREKIHKACITEPEDCRIENIYSLAYLRLITICAAQVTVILNLLIRIATTKLAEYEAWHVRSSMYSYLIGKLAVAQILNCAIIPILMSSSATSDHQRWYARGGLVEEAFYLQLLNALVPNIAQALNIRARISRYFAKHHARTQAMMDALVEPSSFQIPVRYATILKTIGIAILYSSILPSSFFLALAGLLASYFSDTYAALRVCRKPEKLSHRLPTLVPLFIRVAILLHILFAHFIFYPGSGMPSTPFYAALSAYGIFGLGAYFWRRIFGIRHNAELSNAGTDGEAYFDFTEKERLHMKRSRLSIWQAASRFSHFAVNVMMGRRSTKVSPDLPPAKPPAQADDTPPSTPNDDVESRSGGETNEKRDGGFDEHTYHAYTPFYLTGLSVELPVSGEWIHRVSQMYKLPSRPFEARTDLLPHQDPSTGGAVHTAIPERISESDD